MYFVTEIIKDLYKYSLPLLVIILGTVWYKICKTEKNSIPGPRPWPLIGNALQIGLKPYITFMKWGKEYGPIVYLNVVKERIVVLNDATMVKELLNDSLTSGREAVTNPLVYEMCKGPHGIINSDGDTWDAQRKFSIRTLREFGFEKGSIEGLIVNEVNELVNWLKQMEGISIKGNGLLSGPFINVILAMVSSERCDWTKKEEVDALQKVVNFLTSFQKVTDNGLYFVPFLRFILPGVTGWSQYKNDIEDLRETFKETVQKHKETLDRSKPRDYIDCYLKEIEETNNELSSFYDSVGYKNLLGVLFDLFIAGSTTTDLVMTWFLLCISHHQEVQKKIREEIEHIVGLSGNPSLSDRKSMPYTEAVINEVLRFASVAALGVPHRAIADINFKGYLIRKDTTILTNLYGINYNPDIWRDPENFRPERFLSIDQTCNRNGPEQLAFSDGKRKCLGERLAQDELFLFITGLVQAFNILPEDDQVPPDFESGTGLFLREPKPFKILFKARQHQIYFNPIDILC